jgi:hypothetical protein
MSDDQIEEQRNMILEDMKRSQEQMAASQPPMPGAPPGMPGAPPDMGGGEVPGEVPGAPEGGEPPSDPTGQPEEGPVDGAEDEAETQIDDVEEILDRLGSMEFEDEDEDESIFSDEDIEKDEEELKELSAEKKVGRPPEGIKFGTDGHHYGRDPFGHKENQKTYRRRGLSVETKNILDRLNLDKLPNNNKLDKKIII